MIEVRHTEAFASWFGRLADPRVKARILVRIRRLSLGNPGDVRAVGERVSELRSDLGPGYRVDYTAFSKAQVLVLGGGDKRTQAADIRAALELARGLKEMER